MRLIHSLFAATALLGLSLAAHADGFSYTLTTTTPGQGFSFTSATLLTGSTNVLNTSGISNLTCLYGNATCTALSINSTNGAAYYGNSTKVYAQGFSFALGTQTVGTNTLAINALPTPEPSSLVLLGTGLLGFAGAARRRYFNA